MKNSGIETLIEWVRARATDDGRLALTAEEGARLLATERGRTLAVEAYDRLDFTALEEAPESTGGR